MKFHHFLLVSELAPVVDQLSSLCLYQKKIKARSAKEEAQVCIHAHRLSVTEQAFCLFHHLEGEAQEEIRYCATIECEDPTKVISILRELYGCSQSYCMLPCQRLFSRRQHEEETFLFRVFSCHPGPSGKNQVPKVIPNSEGPICWICLR